MILKMAFTVSWAEGHARQQDEAEMRTLYLREPSSNVLSRFLAEQAAWEFGCLAVGATATKPPAGFTLDRTRIELGTGEAVFDAARNVLQRSQQSRLNWVDVWSPETPHHVGQVVAIMGRAVGFRWLNSCRVVYTLDEFGPITKLGFAHGTLPGHIASGEERILIEWARHTNQVAYDILAFSQPNHALPRLGYPRVRRSQKRFGRDSAASMFWAVNAASALSAVLQSTE